MSPPSIPTPRNVQLLYLHRFLNCFCPHSAYLVIYFNQVSGSYAASMMVIAVDALSSALCDIPTGVLSDRIGRKYTIAFGSCCYAMAVTCYALAHSFGVLIVGAVLMGLGRCLFNGNNTALLYETLKTTGQEDSFAHYQGRTGSMFQFALGLSALCGGLLSIYGLQFVFLVGIVPQILAILVCFFFVEPSVHAAHKRENFAHLKEVCKHIIQNKRLILLIFAQGISYGAGEATFRSKTAFANMLWPTWAVGLYRATTHAFGFVSFWFAGKAIDRFKSLFLLIFAAGYWFLTQGLAVLLANRFSPVLLALENVVYGSCSVARDQLLQNEFTDAQRATLGSVASFTGSILYALIAVCIGIISDHFGLAAGIGFGVCVGALSLPIFVHLFCKHF